GVGSDRVRELFVENALFWVTHAHIDGLRLDAVHAIVGPTAYPSVEELTASVHRRGHALGRPVTVIAESADNDPLLIEPPARGGRGLDGCWNDELHHALHVVLTGEQRGYYADFGSVDHLARAISEGFVHRGT